jgi:hypothetical protein
MCQCLKSRSYSCDRAHRAHVTAIYRPRKLCRTFAMHDVSALFESDDDQPEGDSVANGNYSDTDHEESEGEEPEATAMMLSDEVSDR